MTRQYFGSVDRARAFTLVKYSVYVLLFINIFLFLREELLAFEHTFRGDIEPSQFIQAFSSSIDTAAWVILLLLFELETSFLDDDKIVGKVKWSLHGVRAFCYLFILYSVSGYYAELTTLYEVIVLTGMPYCDLVSQQFSLVVDLDEYVKLNADNCALPAGEVYQIKGFNIVAPEQTMQAIRYLAWTDMINSSTWVLVVLILEIEVRMQLVGKLTDTVMGMTKILKVITYTTLFACAVYWGFAGDFIDFWDAFLWLFAFIFIELNLFNWQYETQHG